MLNQEKTRFNSLNLMCHSQSQPIILVVISDAERTCNQGIQSNLDIMPPTGTEVKWDSNKSGVVTRACCSIDEAINTANKRINDYSICTLCTVHVMYSPSYATQAKTLNNRQLSHVLKHFIFQAIT